MTTSGSSGPPAFRAALLAAAPGLARPLPWVGHADPWAIYVSEVMLQQTSAARVEAPWRTFLDRFSTPTQCADARLAEVLVVWGALGYPRRARNLHRAATVMRDEHEGRVPRDPAQLRALPGVGPYTAAAVASFAFGAPVAVLDTNVGRVLSRALSNAPLATREARELAATILAVPSAPFNQAMIDLGAQFCRARPRCEECPVSATCRWHSDGGADPAPHSAAVSRPQATYAGSERQLRGRVMAELRVGRRATHALRARLGDEARFDAVVDSLVADGLVERTRATLALARR